MKENEIIHFSLFNLHLQEPVALIFNWSMALFCFIAFFNISKKGSESTKMWRMFFLVFGISTFLGGFGHILFGYFGIYGKFPHWIGGIVSAYFAGNAMIVDLKNIQLKSRLKSVLIIKAILFLSLAFIKTKFIFVAIDAIATYLFFCGGIGLSLYKKGVKNMKYIILGVLICIPSAFVYILNINLSIWFNKDDLSHVFMFACLIFFFIGAKKMSETPVR